MIEADAARDLVAQSARALDAEDWPGFLALCASDFAYRILVPTPELRRAAAWLDLDQAGMTALLDALDTHLRRPGTLLRQLGYGLVSNDGAAVETSLLIVHTDTAGRSALWAAGRYRDTLVDTPDGLRLAARDVVLDTRDLGVGSHVPL